MFAEEESLGSRMRERLVKHARFKVNATPESHDYGEGRGLQRSLIAELCTGRWIDSGGNLIITGPIGDRQYSRLLRAWPRCRKVRSVRYFRVNLLLEQMGLAREEGTIRRMRAQVAKADLVILDHPIFADAILDQMSQQACKI